MKILFWNTHNNIEINKILSELIIENQVNITALVEHKANVNELLRDLDAKGVRMIEYPTIGCNNIKIIGDKPLVTPGPQNDCYSIQIMQKQYILCCVHLPSQIYTNNEGAREIKISTIVEDIEKMELLNNTDKTIIVGDLNINPFDHGCIDANLFHSLPYFEIARKTTRSVASKKFKMFYNPMWRFFGDNNSPAGTHFYNGSRIDNIFWHIYDQVMVRPCLRNDFIDESLKIITKTSRFLLSDIAGHPDKQKASDHFPIVFEIKEN